MATFRIVPHQDGWGVAHADGEVTGPYATKEAAFEASAAAASNAIKDGAEVTITVPARRSGEPALGAH